MTTDHTTFGSLMVSYKHTDGIQHSQVHSQN